MPDGILMIRKYRRAILTSTIVNVLSLLIHRLLVFVGGGLRAAPLTSLVSYFSLKEYIDISERSGAGTETRPYDC